MCIRDSHRIIGIVNKPGVQVVYSDTPGVVDPAYKMQEQGADEVLLRKLSLIHI